MVYWFIEFDDLLTCHSIVNECFISIVSKWFIPSIIIWRGSKDYHYWTGTQDTKVHFLLLFIILLLFQQEASLLDKYNWFIWFILENTCNISLAIQPAFIKEKNIFPFLYHVLVSWFSGLVRKTASWKTINGSNFPNHKLLIRTST